MIGNGLAFILTAGLTVLAEKDSHLPMVPKINNQVVIYALMLTAGLTVLAEKDTDHKPYVRGRFGYSPFGSYS